MVNGSDRLAWTIFILAANRSGVKKPKTPTNRIKKRVLELAQDRLKTLQDLPKLTSYFFVEPELDTELIDGNKQLRKLTDDERRDLLSIARQEFEKITDWTPETIQNCLNQLLETTGQKPGILFSLVRIVTTWAPFSPQLNDTLALIGKKKTLQESIIIYKIVYSCAENAILSISMNVEKIDKSGQKRRRSLGVVQRMGKKAYSGNRTRGECDGYCWSFHNCNSLHKIRADR